MLRERKVLLSEKGVSTQGFAIILALVLLVSASSLNFVGNSSNNNYSMIEVAFNGDSSDYHSRRGSGETNYGGQSNSSQSSVTSTHEDWTMDFNRLRILINRPK